MNRAERERLRTEVSKRVALKVPYTGNENNTYRTPDTKPDTYVVVRMPPQVRRTMRGCLLYTSPSPRD